MAKAKDISRDMKFIIPAKVKLCNNGKVLCIFLGPFGGVYRILLDKRIETGNEFMHLVEFISRSIGRAKNVEEIDKIISDYFSENKEV